MKQLFLILFSLITLNSVNAQNPYTTWKSIPFTDEFDRPTGDTARVLYCKGKFTNTAVQNNPKFTAKIIWDSRDESIIIKLFEYNQKPSARMGYRSTTGSILALVGKDAKEPTKFKGIFAPESGGLYIRKESNPKLYKAITTESFIHFLVEDRNFTSGHGTTKYIFKLELTQN